jgi:hypothetical protein
MSKHYWYAYDDDPTFQQFRGSINAVCEEVGAKPPGLSFCYKLWYESKMFRTHWESNVTTKAAKQITFILSERLSSLVNAHSVMFAWARRNHPNVTLGWFQQFLGDVFEPEWERLAQWREKKLDERNAKRRKMYQERKGGVKKPRHPNLGERIYLELNREPSTAKVLAITLQVSRKTIESQLLRMCVKEFISKMGKGLYVVPKEQNLTRTSAKLAGA